jgi:acyl-CoA oxidase
LEDVAEFRQKFWDIHTDPIAVTDGAAPCLLTIHYNLFLGTVAPYANKSPEMRRMVDEALKFNVM